MAASLRGRTNQRLTHAAVLLEAAGNAKPLPREQAAHLHAVHLMLQQAYRCFLTELLDAYAITGDVVAASDAARLLSSQGLVAQELDILVEAEQHKSWLRLIASDWQDQRSVSQSQAGLGHISVMQVSEDKEENSLSAYKNARLELTQCIEQLRDLAQQW